MEYTIKSIARLAGVTTRTLRYYDEIGLLKPTRINSSGYRIYGEKEVNLLQLILFYRELEFNLDSIKELIHSANFDILQALKNHKKDLITKKERLEVLIKNIDKTIENRERRVFMSDKDKFDGFKNNLIKENEEKYGKEVREKYGNKSIDKSNQKIKNMTENKLEEVNLLANEIITKLNQAFTLGDPSSDLAQEVAYLHRKWICSYWSDYSYKAHRALAEMYVTDDRFRAYYDKEQSGVAEFLKQAIIIYTNKNK